MRKAPFENWQGSGPEVRRWRDTSKDEVVSERLIRVPASLRDFLIGPRHLL